MRSTNTANEKRVRRTEDCTRRIKQTDSKSCSGRQSETVARVEGKTSSKLVYFDAIWLIFANITFEKHESTYNFIYQALLYPCEFDNLTHKHIL